MIQTILCKDIISEDLEEFKNQIKCFNSGSIDDTMFTFTQQILLAIYGNCYIRYETAENFLNALSLRFYNIAPIYYKKFNILAETLDIETEYFISNVKDFAENKNNTITTSQNDNKREAETPTGVKASTDFVEKYTNSASKSETTGQSQEYGQISHKETNTDAILEKLENWRTMLYEKYSKEFANLFVQFI